MARTDAGPYSGIRYQPDERPPATLVIGVGLQLAVLNLAAIMLIPTVVMRAAGQDEVFVAWAVFATVAVSGLTTMLQALRLGRFGGGHVLLMGASAAFISVSITAVAEGGPALLATLVVITAFVPLALSWRLALVQRVITPTVAGTVIMLTPSTVLPAVGDLLTNLPAGSPTAGAPLSRGPRLHGGVAGSPARRLAGTGPYLRPRLLVAVTRLPAGGGDRRRPHHEQRRRRTARLVARHPGGRLSRGAGCGDRGRPGQPAVGTLPNTTYSVSAPLIELTGVAARTVGIAAGTAFVLLVFLPKALAAILAVPDPVFAGYLLVLLALLFLVGLRIVVQDGLDPRKGMTVGIALLIGVGSHYGMIFPELLEQFADGLLRNGMNFGGYTAILMTLFVALAGSRRSRFRAVRLEPSVLPEISRFLAAFAAHGGLAAAMAQRIGAAAEETLLREAEDGTERGRRSLLLVAYREASRPTRQGSSATCRCACYGTLRHPYATNSITTPISSPSGCKRRRRPGEHVREAVRVALRAYIRPCEARKLRMTATHSAGFSSSSKCVVSGRKS